VKKIYSITTLMLLLVAVWWIGALPVSTKTEVPPNTTILQLSEQLLYAVKTEAATDSLEKALSSLEVNDVVTGLNNDTARKVFWINMYNAWFQLLALKEKKTSPEIYAVKSVAIAGHLFSLDDIEHGILRKYRWKYSEGYLPQFLPPALIKKLAVSNIDYRIHFTLNCGAKSCPAIAFYTYKNLEEQLNMATRVFLKGETTVDHQKKEIHTSKILDWYKGDFGGTKGVLSILAGTLQQDLTGYNIKFNEYDWTTQLKNYNTGQN
jgi:Protein of unknown function, DUF547